MKIPMSSPDLTQREVEAVVSVLSSPHLSMGPRLAAFENSFVDRLAVPHALGVSSGTAGLHLCVLAAGWGPGDVVITSPFSFVASANCLLYENVVPVFVDVDETTGNIDPARVEEAVTALVGDPMDPSRLPPSCRRSGRDLQLGGILVVDTFGQPADVDPILEVASKAGLPVVEDACEAIGASYKGREAGTLADAGVFAFYPNKQITTGEGGMVVTRRDDWAHVVKSLRNQGRDVFSGWLDHPRLGYNYRLDELSAAIGVVQLERLDEILRKREQVARWYLERLPAIEAVAPPVIGETTTKMSWFVFVIRLEDAEKRMSVLRHLEREGIPARPYFPVIHLQKHYASRFGYKRGDFPVAERLGDRSLALPFSSIMTEEQVDYVCGRLAEAVTAS